MSDHTSGDFDTDISAGRIVKAYAGPTADQVLCDNTTSGLAAANVKGALDEIVARVAALEAP